MQKDSRRSLVKKISYVLLTTLSSLTLFFTNPVLPDRLSPAMAETVPQTSRIAGTSRYDTALQISLKGWTGANTVVLSRGDDFPDALAGAVLANSPKAKGPLLLTEPNALSSELLNEINRLKAQKIYILGGTGAVSQGIENILKNNYPSVVRLDGKDRYETASKIALEAVSSSAQAFLASGNSFADALSISSYAANKEIPLLLTDADAVPEITLQALQKLGASSVTLIGGEGIIKPSVKAQLESKGLSVTRYAGADRYLTNVDVLSKLNLDTSSVYVATGNDFPDALAGAVLAAKRNNPILLVPSTDLNSQTTNYLSARRTGGSSFTLLGGWGVISYKLENIIRTGSIKPRISLQYLQAYGSSAYTTYLSQINMAPGKATDYVDFVAPNWYAINNIPSGKTVADGTFTGPWDTASNNYTQIVNAAHGRGLKVLPVIGSSWDSEGKAAVDSIMKEPTARTSLVNNLVRMLAATGADGVVIDLEYMSDETGPYLTEFMKELYAALHPKNKIVIQAVMSRTSSTDWYPEFNYKELSQHVDYLNIMTYDYSMSVPGPIAPISWAKKVLEYTKSQGVDMSKVLIGVPYYGRDWAQKDATSYTKKSVGLMSATNAATEYKATIQRETSPEDSVGIPNYSYTDADKIVHKVYFDDPLSWERKLMLMQEYNLGGIGAWSMMWVTDEIGKELFPVLNRNLR